MNNQELIKKLGIENLSPERQQAILDKVIKTLNLKVGIALSDALSNDQLEEFQKLVSAGDQPASEVWLEANYPDYKNLVVKELEAVISEVKQMSGNSAISDQV